MQLTTDHAQTCLNCGKVFSRGRGLSNAAALLCQNCWTGMIRWYASRNIRPRQFYPDHVHAFVTYTQARREEARQGRPHGTPATGPV